MNPDTYIYGHLRLQTPKYMRECHGERKTGFICYERGQVASWSVFGKTRRNVYNIQLSCENIVANKPRQEVYKRQDVPRSVPQASHLQQNHAQTGQEGSGNVGANLEVTDSHA
jgi:hypothetical protein